MTRKIAIIIICMLIISLASTAVLAAEHSTAPYEQNYLNLLSILISFLGLILAGLLIVLIKSYACFKIELQKLYKIAADTENYKNENVINIRKHNDQELLDKLYNHIDKRLDEMELKNEN